MSDRIFAQVDLGVSLGKRGKYPRNSECWCLQVLDLESLQVWVIEELCGLGESGLDLGSAGFRQTKKAQTSSSVRG